MKKIFKYKLDAGFEPQVLELPWDSKILSVASQHGRIVVYASVSENTDMERHKVQVVPTGHEVPDEPATLFLGTVSFGEGYFVFHVFHLGVTH